MGKIKAIFLVTLFLSLLHAQQTIDLRGTITNASGAPVAGAEVRLMKKKLSAVSGSDGRYRLSLSANTQAAPWAETGLKSCTVKHGVLSVAAPPSDRAEVSLFDTRGRLFWKAAIPTGPNPRAVTLPHGSFAGQTGLLRVDIGTGCCLFLYTNTGAGAAFAARQENKLTHGKPGPGRAGVAGALPIHDTLAATGNGFAANATVRLYVYAFVDTMDFSLGEPDSNSEARQQCVHRINTYRSSLYLAPLRRNKAMESCVDGQCRSDSETGAAHGAFGKCSESAQNECPEWKGQNPAAIRNSIVVGCLQMMWDEGPGEPYSAHGHYINMSNPAYTKVACGFYFSPSKKAMWGIQDFWSK